MRNCLRNEVLNGETVFRMIDSDGIPFEVVCHILRERGIGFDLKQFVVSAYSSGNYTYTSLKKVLLREAKTESAKRLIEKLFY